MAGDYMIYDGNRHLGRVTSFAGNKPSERWVAYARRAQWSDPENTERFRTRKAAIQWLHKQAA